ncbi:MAG: transglutaminase-like domain-containing protein [Gemmatimonadota bacterium]|nr:transglutaminase-like domain-containing protein [Gemmatimonadota bacterium]
MQCLRRLFDHLTSSTYRYLWPPPARGSTSMRTSQTGDCGNYSALFAAWCRSMKLPARVVIGTWTRGIMQAHAWCEVFIDDIGWIPVDASVAATLRVNRAHFDGLIDAPAGFPPAVQPDTYLGALDRGRLAFSFEMDPHALPGYQEWSSPPSGAPRLSHSTGDVYWGYTLLNGKAPYLQPAYPLFHGPMSKVTDKRLLGTWELIPHASRSIPRMAGPAALAAAALVLLVLILNHGLIRREMGAHAFLAACGLFAGIRAIQGSARVINSIVAISLFSVLAWRILS